MAFKMKYSVNTSYLPKGTKRRSGIKANKIRFVVLHDVGNDGYNKSTGRRNGTTAKANINYYKNSPTVSASAHTFIDDVEILECIPAVTAAAEKAWHVLYNKTKDNQMYGADANDAAIGVELCYYPEDKARSLKAYQKYVWYCAYLAYYFKLDPATCFVGHETLDPGRKSDPTNGLKWSGKSTAQCVKDIIAEYNECLGKTQAPVVVTAPSKAVAPATSSTASSKQIGTVTVLVSSLNVRNDASFSAKTVKTIKKDDAYKVYESKNGLYRIGVDEWCSAGDKYVKFTPVSANGQIGVVEILADSLNVRNNSDFNAKVLKALSKGTKWKVYKEENGMYNLGGDQWCSANAKYVKFTKA